MPGGESPRATMREHYVSPSLGILSQRQMLQRGGDGRVAGKGDGGEQSWGDCEERRSGGTFSGDLPDEAQHSRDEGYPSYWP